MAKITVLKQEVVTPPGKKYQVCELGYKTEEGKVKAMKIFGFGDQKAVFDVASKAQPGDVIEAQFAQNDKGYWQFSGLAPTGEKVSPSVVPTGMAGGSGSSRGNWETPEERAARQVMIVRQSSLSNAIALHAAASPKGTEATVDDIVTTAKFFEAYVLGKPTITGEVE